MIIAKGKKPTSLISREDEILKHKDYERSVLANRMLLIIESAKKK